MKRIWEKHGKVTTNVSESHRAQIPGMTASGPSVVRHYQDYTGAQGQALKTRRGYHDGLSFS